MVAQPNRLLTPEEYLAFERESEVKHEYVAGEVFAMAGAGEAHNLIVANVLAWLRPQLRGRNCRIYPSDMRVKVASLGIYMYPDIVVVCGSPQFEDGRRDTLLNPTLLIEILSPSTASHDRGLKFRRYQLIPTFAEYLLIAQDRPAIEHHTRRAAGTWETTLISDPAATLTLPTIGCTLPLSAIYEDVTWDTIE